METYSGHVSPGGRPARRDLGNSTITKLSVGPMDNNTYLITCRRTGDALLVDAADDAKRILELVTTADLATDPSTSAPPTVRAIVTTHRHPDHWQALEAVADATGATTMAGADDADGIPVETARNLHHDDVIVVGTLEFTVIALRGHTPGSVALHLRDDTGLDHLLTGDSLFPGGPGRTQTPADFVSLMDDLERRVFDRFPDSTCVYPGHGDDTTLGTERPQLAEWRARGW